MEERGRKRERKAEEGRREGGKKASVREVDVYMPDKNSPVSFLPSFPVDLIYNFSVVSAFKSHTYSLNMLGLKAFVITRYHQSGVSHIMKRSKFPAIFPHFN